MPGLEVIIPVAVLSGLLCVDFRTSIGLMISQPICGGLLTGLILGEPVKGLLAGALIQIMFLGNISVRGKRVLDLPVAGVTAGSLFILADLELAGDLSAAGTAMILSLIVGLMAGWLGYFVYGWLSVRLSGVVEKVAAQAERGQVWYVSLLNISLLGFHFVYGFVVLALILPLAYRIIIYSLTFSWARMGSVDLLYVFIPFIGIGSLVRSQILKTQAFWFISGLIVGGVVLFLN